MTAPTPPTSPFLSALARDFMSRQKTAPLYGETNKRLAHDLSKESSSSTLQILACSASSGSSHLDDFKNQLLAATSSVLDNTNASAANVEYGNFSREEIAVGPLCEYRKGYLDHLKPKALIQSVRISVASVAKSKHVARTHPFLSLLLVETDYSDGHSTRDHYSRWIHDRTARRRPETWRASGTRQAHQERSGGEGGRMGKGACINYKRNRQQTQ